MRDLTDGKPRAVTEATESAGDRDGDAQRRRTPREIIADYERYKYELYKEKYIHGD